jgi:hypothetical protein
LAAIWETTLNGQDHRLDLPIRGAIRLYLARTGYTHGPLFRASINGTGGPLSYDAAHHRWRTYCTAAGVSFATLTRPN